ncbi:hypothetical protein GCM10007968_08770 [Sporolactobacillus putidus]|uniref:Uncharacterized protein n=1 Tax=Sporolactobacillus putidus TaxID=492735 RepID=A0A917S0P4_9BACL|nr:hypothetical protein GCM10007968_08770 [Sporolactobacillus putidus]
MFYFFFTAFNLPDNKRYVPTINTLQQLLALMKMEMTNDILSYSEVCGCCQGEPSLALTSER